MTLFFRRLAKAAPVAFSNAFKGSQNSTPYTSRTPFGVIAASITGGISLYYLTSSPNLAHLDSINEETQKKVVPALNPDKWLEFKLQETATVSHNTKLYRFSFDSEAVLGLHIASCLLTRAPTGQNDEGKTKYVVRPYTPISDPDSKGYFDLMIKIYPEGKMSQHFAKLKPGDVVEVKGPIEKLRYTCNMKKHIGMIAGGTGVTPMLQVAEAILKNPDNKTLDWRGGVGYVSKDVVPKGLPGPGDDTLIMVCGPPGMMQNISGDKAKDYSQGEVDTTACLCRVDAGLKSVAGAKNMSLGQGYVFNLTSSLPFILHGRILHVVTEVVVSLLSFEVSSMIWPSLA